MRKEEVMPVLFILLWLWFIFNPNSHTNGRS